MNNGSEYIIRTSTEPQSVKKLKADGNGLIFGMLVGMVASIHIWNETDREFFQIVIEDLKFRLIHFHII